MIPAERRCVRFITGLLFELKSAKLLPAISAPAQCNAGARMGAAKCCRDGARVVATGAAIIEKSQISLESSTPLPSIHDGSVIPEGALAMRPRPRKLRLPPRRSEATTLLADWNGPGEFAGTTGGG